MDFALFYDEQPDYTEFRNNPEKQEDYKIVVDWKVRTLLKNIPEDFKSDNILEIGCAFGVLLNNISDRLKIENRIGIDIAKNNIEAAKTLFPESRFFNGTLEEYIGIEQNGLLNDAPFLVVLSDIVEHIPDDLGFLKLVNKHSSYVLLNLPLEKSFKTRNRVYGEQDPSGHLRCYDKTSAAELVTKAGFEIVRSFTEISFFDSSCYKIYVKERNRRVRSKPLLKRIFWSCFYFFEDRVKLLNRGLTEKMIGSNYFALLKSNR